MPGFRPPFDQTPGFRPPFDQTPGFRPPFDQTPGFRPPYGIPGLPHQRFRRCMNRMTYVTLNNGNSFWFYPTDIRRQMLTGFRWRRNRWEPSSIAISRVLRMNCN